MPYIAPEKRTVLDPHINALLNALRELESDDPANAHCGNLNYIFTKLLAQSYANDRYPELNEAIGVLECCKLEIYRVVGARYEDQERWENGDVA